MATLFTNSKFAATDANGNPLAGGKVYTYVAGTTTPKATYTTQGGTVANANPVILDSSGRADIWLGSGAYKIVVTDSTGAAAPDGTVDNIVAGTGTDMAAWQVNSVSTVTLTAGNTLVTFTGMVYTPGTNSLLVFADGVLLVPVTDYTETSTTQITLTASFAEDVQITGIGGRLVSSGLSGNDVSFSATTTYNSQTVGKRLRDEGYYVTDYPWLAKGDGVTDDTAAIVAANAAAKAAGKTLYFPKTDSFYLYKPTAPLECGMWAGESMETVIIKADCSAYTGSKVVFRLTKSSEWRDLSIYELSGSTANGILVQLSDTTATNVAGGANTFTAYTDLHRIRIIGGAIALDIGNIFTSTFSQCQFRQAGIGVRIVPTDDAGDNGYANTLTFLNCEISENVQNWLANGVGSQIKGLLVLGGSTERCTTTSSSFTNLLGASFIGHYIEQTAAVSPMTFVGCTGLVLRLIPVGTQCDLTLGTNTEVSIENWNNGSATSRLLGADGTQTVTLRNCVFPTSGNSPFYNFAKFSAYGSSYNGVTYDVYTPTISVPESNRIDRQTTVVTAAGATDVYLFRDRKTSVQNSNTCGILSISAVDTSTGANSATYVYALTGNSNGASNVTLTQLSRTTRGTDPGTSATPFSVAADGGGGAAKVQFTRNAAVASVTVVAQFVGLVV